MRYTLTKDEWQAWQAGGPAQDAVLDRIIRWANRGPRRYRPIALYATHTFPNAIALCALCPQAKGSMKYRRR